MHLKNALENTLETLRTAFKDGISREETRYSQIPFQTPLDEGGAIEKVGRPLKKKNALEPMRMAGYRYRRVLWQKSGMSRAKNGLVAEKTPLITPLGRGE